MRKLLILLVLVGALALSSCAGTGDRARYKRRKVDILNHHIAGNSVQGQARNTTKEMLSMVELTATLYSKGSMPFLDCKTTILYIPGGGIFDFYIPFPDWAAVDGIGYCKVKAEIIQ